MEAYMIGLLFFIIFFQAFLIFRFARALDRSIERSNKYKHSYDQLWTGYSNVSKILDVIYDGNLTKNIKNELEDIIDSQNIITLSRKDMDPIVYGIFVPSKNAEDTIRYAKECLDLLVKSEIDPLEFARYINVNYGIEMPKLELKKSNNN